jgi:endonuclease III-like uncharacterized protein
MNKIMRIYVHLLKEYGPQGWWPVTPSDAEGFFPPVYGVPGRTIKQRLDV